MRKFTKFFLSLMAMLLVTVSANAWKFASAEPANESEVESLDRIVLKLPADAGWLNEFSATFNLTDQNGTVTQCNFSTMSVGIVDTDATFQKITTPGTYTLTIPAGSLHYLDANWAPAEANEAQTFTWTIKGSDDQGGGTQGGGTQGGGDQGGGSQTTGWSFTGVTPAAGTTVESLKSFTFGLPSGINWLNTGGTGTLALPNGETKSVSIYDNLTSINGDILVDNPLTDAGTYTLTIPANAIEGSDGTKNAEMTFSWTIAAPAPTYTVTYANGTTYVTWPEGTNIAATDLSGMMHPTIEGYTGYVSGGSFNAPNVIEVWAELAAGDYTLTFPAGDFTVNNVPNAAFSETFTVGGTQGGGGTFDGEASHEQIFKAGETTVTKNNIVLESDGVKITTVDGEFDLGGTITTIPFGYNTYDEKELDWNNKCKFVITSKKDAISKVIFVPTASSKKAIANASADKGAYENGVWEGKLAAGETLTLTASDGIQIKDIYVCYNGDEFDPTSIVEEKGVITIQYPTENQLIAKQVDGGKFCVFTTNKEYAQVTIEVRNSNPTYDNLFKFPTRMVDNMGENSDNLHVGENTIKAATPASGSAGKGDDWYWFEGDSYTMIVKGYVNPWDKAEDYDAIAEVHFVGNGKEHVAESTTKLINVTPASGSQIAMVNGVVTLEFDGPVSSVTAITPGGMSDPTINHTATAKAGSDNKVWEINLGDRSGQASADTDGNPTLEVDVTATAADGIVLLSDTRADRGLELKYELVAGSTPTPSAVTLGSPVWSVAENAEIEASTSSINIKFPDATNVEGTYTLEVAGTIGDKQFNLSNVSGTGTMANGADIAVSLSEDKGYNLVIGTITIKNGETEVYATGMANYQLNFGTTAAQGGGTGDNILGEPTFTATADGIVVEWPNAQVSDINECYISLGEWTLTHKGVDYTTYPDAIEDFTNGVKVEIPYTKVAAWDDVNYVYIPVEVNPGDEINISIAAEGINVYENYYSSFDPAIYTNAEPITGTVTVPGDEPQPQLPTSVIIYEEGADTHTDNTELNFSKYDVTLTSETTGSTYVQNNFKPACSSNTSNHLRLFTYNTLKFAAERDIVQIEFVPVAASAKWGAKSVSTGSFADNVWTGKSKTVDLVLNGTNMDVLKIIVTLAGAPEKVKATMSIGAAKWGTFVAPFEVEIPAGVTAYKVTGRNEGVLELEEVATTIPANTPVVVYSESTVNKEFEGVAVAGTPEAGKLVGVYAEKQVEVGTYVLQNHDGVVGFYKVVSGSNNIVKANRCYLVDSSASAPAFFFTEEDATAINGINADVLGAEGIYNANGVRVNTLQKGLNIIKTANGTKKVMIK